MSLAPRALQQVSPGSRWLQQKKTWCLKWLIGFSSGALIIGRPVSRGRSAAGPPLFQADDQAGGPGHRGDFQPFLGTDWRRLEGGIERRPVGEQQLQPGHGGDAGPQPAVGKNALAPETAAQRAAVEQV